VTLHSDRSIGTDAKFGCFVKIGQFMTTFQFESTICEIKVKKAKVGVERTRSNLKIVTIIQLCKQCDSQLCLLQVPWSRILQLLRMITVQQ
jgi:hypothetical protein